MNIALILLIGGRGERLSSSTPKQFLPLKGKPLYLVALSALLDAYPFDQIILPAPKEWIDIVKMQTGHIPNLLVIPGGESRQASSYLGLRACSDSIEAVMVHDGARPFVSKTIVEDHIKALKEHGAVDTCIPATDTIVARKDDHIDHIPDRRVQMYGQTPQSFHFLVLQKAHLYAIKHGINNSTDDCGLALLAKEKVKIVEGDPRNFKITTAFDYEVAKLIIEKSPPTLEPAQKLDGKIYAMPGGFGDIGKAIIDRLQDLGADVIPLGRAHLKDPLAVEAAFKTIFETYGPLDGLINVAGSLRLGQISELSYEAIEQMLYDNFEVVVYSCKFAAIKEGGHILNIGSTAAKFGRKNYGIYSSAKAAVINFTEALSQERKELFVNVLSPGRTLTKMRREHFPTENVELLGAPSSVADKVSEILSSKITGTHFE